MFLRDAADRYQWAQQLWAEQPQEARRHMIIAVGLYELAHDDESAEKCRGVLGDHAPTVCLICTPLPKKVKNEEVR